MAYLYEIQPMGMNYDKRMTNMLKDNRINYCKDQKSLKKDTIFFLNKMKSII